MAKKVQNRTEHRTDASDFNVFSDDTSVSANGLQRLIEKVSEKVDTSSGKVEKSADRGSEGSIRAVKDKTNWYLEFKTADGWIRSDSSTASGFKLKK
tara:strand:+ start:141 stop:431 length:291 start_codon:yes stop_codon:yes gene_type:complete